MKTLLPIALFAIAGILIIRSFTGSGAANDIPEQVHRYQCTECETVFTKTNDELKRMIKDGKTQAEPGRTLAVECDSCKKFTAYVVTEYRMDPDSKLNHDAR